MVMRRALSTGRQPLINLELNGSCAHIQREISLEIEETGGRFVTGWFLQLSITFQLQLQKSKTCHLWMSSFGGASLKKTDDDDNPHQASASCQVKDEGKW